MPSPTHNPGDQPTEQVGGPAPQDARPGRHPSAEARSGGRTAAIALAIVLALVALVMLARVVAATLTG
jgi:hypothetical protein